MTKTQPVLLPEKADAAPPPAPAATALSFAIGELGVREEPPGSNTGPRVREYLKPTGLDRVPWCAAFACWCAEQAGSPLPHYRPATHSLVEDARADGKWHPVGSGYAPKPDDVEIHKRDGQDPTTGGEGHTCRVETTADGSGLYTTIDGNHEDAVMRVTRHVADPDCCGWIES